MSSTNLRVNGQSHALDLDPATPLLYVLSDDLALRGPKFGCGLGQCGACTVIMGGRAIRSCVTPVSAAANSTITTLEGLGTIEKPHPIQQAFIDEQAAQSARASDTQLDSWLAVGGDGIVTAYTGKCELGQGLQTAQIQLIAEELFVPVGRVRLVQCDTAVTPDQGTTSGSQSHPTNFNQHNLALAAATARETLLQLAAARLGVAGDQLAVADGVVSAKTDPSKKIAYRDLLGGRKFNIGLDPN